MLWPTSPERFGLSRLVVISGVDAATIKRWNHRRSVRFRRIPIGTVRSYRLGEALHLAVIAEMSRLGLTITGEGAGLTAAVTEWIAYHLRDDPDVRKLKPVALVPIVGEDDFLMDDDLSRATAGGSCVVVGTRQIADGVAERYFATA